MNWEVERKQALSSVYWRLGAIPKTTERGGANTIGKSQKLTVFEEGHCEEKDGPTKGQEVQDAPLGGLDQLTLGIAHLGYQLS